MGGFDPSGDTDGEFGGGGLGVIVGGGEARGDIFEGRGDGLIVVVGHDDSWVLGLISKVALRLLGAMVMAGSQGAWRVRRPS